MKKIISLILTAVCFISVFTMINASVMTDEQKEDLANLGILTGDPDGDMRLDDTISRAEAIKAICTAGNVGTELIEMNAFPDVSENHWAYEYISAAKANGIIHGDDDGNFNPESNVTNEEFVKMMICLLGYQAKGDNCGGFPAGYTAIAAQIGLTKSLQLDVNVPATRNNACIMINNSLDVPLMLEKIGDNGESEYIIMDEKSDFGLVTLRNGFVNYDSSADNISRLSKTFASKYLYKEGDTEKSFELYPDILYTSGIEKTADGKEYECPAIYDDRMVPELANEIGMGEAKLLVDGINKAYRVKYVIFKDKTLIPLNVFRLAGCNVNFDKAAYVATVSKGSTVLELMPNIIGMRKNQAEGFWIPLEVCARFVDNALYVPMEAVTGELAINAVWDHTANTITLQ